jgi:peptide deformylase
MELKLYIAPDPMLRNKAAEVEHIGKELAETFAAMEDIMARLDGIGMAGPQVGALRRIIAIDAATIAREEGRPAPAKRYLRLVNPKIVSVSGDTGVREEGCLSVPTIYANVARPLGVAIEYADERGGPHSLEADGLLARCILHELDHLEGKLFIDYLSPLRRRMIESKLKKLRL